MQRVLFFPGFGRRIRKMFRWHARPAMPFVRKELPTEFKYYGGSNHGVFSRVAVFFLFVVPLALFFFLWAKHTLLVNEIVFQTVLVNSPLRPFLQNTDLREIDFNPASPHPHTFTIGDFD